MGSNVSVIISLIKRRPPEVGASRISVPPNARHSIAMSPQAENNLPGHRRSQRIGARPAMQETADPVSRTTSARSASRQRDTSLPTVSEDGATADNK